LEKFLYSLLILVPVTLVLSFSGADDPVVFVASALALVPLAALLGRATDVVATHTGPRVGALLNATFGNAAELIITTVALREGLIAVVKASIAGSVIGNILIVVGASALIGGLKHGTQTFNPRAASANAGLMGLAVVSLVIPAVFGFGVPNHRLTEVDLERLSVGVALALMLAYALYLTYSLRSMPARVARAATAEVAEVAAEEAMRLPVAILLLAGATVAIVVMSEILIGVFQPTAAAWGLSDLFVGVILVPLIGNVAEHVVAVQAALRNEMDLSLGIAIGSALQIALFVAPILVLVSQFVGHPMTLVFNPFELTALLAGTFVAVIISLDGESNWLEGAELVILYAIIGIAFYFVP
jgi:Ca2+:H+ antiporter